VLLHASVLTRDARLVADRLHPLPLQLHPLLHLLEGPDSNVDSKNDAVREG
jgi:hypothetical protein